MLKNLKIFFCSFFWIYFFLPFWAYAQLDNSLLEERISPNPSREQELWVKLHNFNYLRNNEYFNPIVSGATYLGSQLSFSLVYDAKPSLRLETGVFLQRDFGAEALSRVVPLLSLVYQVDSTKIIFGNLQNNYAHRLIEPLYAFERGIENRLEQGLQFVRHRPRWYAELWIDWQQTVSAAKDRPQLFWVGLVNDWTILKHKNFRLHLPLQATIFHTGGQDLTVPVSLGNELNVALGLKATQSWQKSSFLRKISTEHYAVFSSEQYSGLAEISRSGSAIYSNLGFDTAFANLLISFWQGKGFNTKQGGDLYKSFSQIDANLPAQERTLLFFRLIKEWEIERDFALSLRADPYYDFQNQLWEFNFGFYMVYRPGFRLINFSKK